MLWPASARSKKAGDGMGLLFSVYIVYLAGAFLFKYASDEGYQPPSFLADLDLRRPSLSDLQTYDKYLADTYVSEVICPAYCYFDLLADLKVSCKKAQDSQTVSFIMLYVPTCAAFVQILKSFACSFHSVFLWLFGVALWVLGDVFVSLIYKRSFAIPSFRYDETDYKTDKEILFVSGPKYGESREAALNNFVLLQHYNYLCSIWSSLSFRFAIARVLCFVTGAAYLLFFFSPEL